MKARLVSLLLITVSLLACGRLHGPVKEVEAYTDAKEPLFEEMVKVVKADPTEVGVDKAGKLWEAKKSDLKSKRDAIDAAPQGMNNDWQAVYFRSQGRTKTELDGMESELMSADAAKAKFKALRSDIETTLKLK